MTLKEIFAAGVVLAGTGVLISGFIVNPSGEIHTSVLIAFGEALLYGGIMLGVDMSHFKVAG